MTVANALQLEAPVLIRVTYNAMPSLRSPIPKLSILK